MLWLVGGDQTGRPGQRQGTGGEEAGGCGASGGRAAVDGDEAGEQVGSRLP